MGTSHLLIFTKFGLGKGLPGPHCHAKFYRCRLKNVYSPKIAKTVFFGINLPDPKGKFWRSTEKVEYRYTTTNLPLCNDTITVLKITLLHSVSVITNFVIPKRDKKQTDQKSICITSEAMQYRQASWAILTKICFFRWIPKSVRSL